MDGGKVEGRNILRLTPSVPLPPPVVSKTITLL
jgi:hypothetical protein